MYIRNWAARGLSPKNDTIIFSVQEFVTLFLSIPCGFGKPLCTGFRLSFVIAGFILFSECSASEVKYIVCSQYSDSLKDSPFLALDLLLQNSM